MELLRASQIRLSSRFVQQLEKVENSYWMRYYHTNTAYPMYSSIIGGGMACAIPTLDVLAMNRVIGLGQESSIDERTLHHVMRFYEKAGSSRFFIQLPPNILLEDTEELLIKAGFTHHNNWTKLFRTVSPWEVTTHQSLSIRQIDQSESDNYGQLIFMSFDWEDTRLDSWLSGTIGQEGYRHYIVSWDGRDIAAGALFVEGDMASMAFAGTLAGFRGHGAQQLLLKRRLQDAFDQGARFITGETAEHREDSPVVSYLNMKKCGFQTAYQRQNWIYRFE